MRLLRLALLCLCWSGFGHAWAYDQTQSIRVTELPPEARQTLALIRQNGPYPYAKDGSTFGNYERRLPSQTRGYYREYTVPTPGAHNRGARRIITGRDGTAYYSGDHYRSFQRIRE